MKNANKAMGDQEAFVLFLGGQLQKLLLGDEHSPEFTEGLDWLGWGGKVRSVPAMLYELTRSPLVHEAALPQHIVFAQKAPLPPKRQGISHISQRGYDVAWWEQGEKIGLSYGWLDLLADVVRRASCNAQDFGPQPALPPASIILQQSPPADG